jgi:hypothetical protein
MPKFRLVLRWCGLAAVVSTVMGVVYFLAIPLVLPRLWPEVRLLLAILPGMLLLAFALTRHLDTFLPSEPRPGNAENGGAAEARSPSASDLEEERRYEALLLRMAGGDQARVERLVEYERQQHPHMTRVQLLQAAYESWERDRR